MPGNQDSLAEALEVYFHIEIGQPTLAFTSVGS